MIVIRLSSYFPAAIRLLDFGWLNLLFKPRNLGRVSVEVQVVSCQPAGQFQDLLHLGIVFGVLMFAVVSGKIIFGGPIS